MLLKLYLLHEIIVVRINRKYPIVHALRRNIQATDHIS